MEDGANFSGGFVDLLRFQGSKKMSSSQRSSGFTQTLLTEDVLGLIETFVKNKHSENIREDAALRGGGLRMLLPEVKSFRDHGEGSAPGFRLLIRFDGATQSSTVCVCECGINTGRSTSCFGDH